MLRLSTILNTSKTLHSAAQGRKLASAPWERNEIGVLTPEVLHNLKRIKLPV